MIIGKANRQKEIFELFRDVEHSSLSVKDYFASNHTPVSRAQYYFLKKRYEQIGIEALEDQRQSGNARKVKPEQEELVIGILTYNRHLTSKSLEDELQSTWGREVRQGRRDQLRRTYNLTRMTPKIVEKETAQFAGIEIFSALAHHRGILEQWLETITQRLNKIPQTHFSKDGKKQSGGDHIYARRKGKFSARYNRLSNIRKKKFASISEKVKQKDLSRLSLCQTQEDRLNRKNLAVLLLPLVT
ncbi:MAG: helix-turn-helix domain-containing protein, partial [bacterium]|nr:helix-turn-helix domain-containing protein [bacterium]